MTPEAKARLSKTIRALRERLLVDLDDALRSDYSLGISAEQAKLPDARAQRRKRLDTWVAEQVRGLPEKERKTAKQLAIAEARFRHEVVKQAAYTWLNRLVYLRLLEGMKLRPAKLITGGLNSNVYGDFRDLAQAMVGSESDESDGYMLLLGLVFDEISLELPGLFERGGLSELVPMRWATLRQVIEALDEPELASCWADDMTLGWVYQYWNDPEREALDERVKEQHKIQRHEIASKTQMFTDRYIVDWLLQNSLGSLWLAICAKNGWTAKVVANGTLARLEARRVDWRAKRGLGVVEVTDSMPLHSDEERHWAYHIEQPMSAHAPALAPESVRAIKLLDPAVGSGHFLVVAFDLLVACYREEAEHRGEVGQAQWSDQAIVESIVANNLHGIDVDPRAVQIAAAAMLLKSRCISAVARPAHFNLVASDLDIGKLPSDHPAIEELREKIKDEIGVPPQVTDALIRALSGADYLGSLLNIGEIIGGVLAESDQGSLFGGVSEAGVVRATLEQRLEEFLDEHSSSAELGLHMKGQQLSAGVRFIRLLRENTYDIIAMNPPYHVAGKMASDAVTFQSLYPGAKADLFAAFVQRSMGLLRPGGYSASVTLSNWMFLGSYFNFRVSMLTEHKLMLLGDLGKGAFSSGSNLISASMNVFVKGAAAAEETPVAMCTYERGDISTDSVRVVRNEAALLCQVGRFEFDPVALRAVPEWPLVYWWDPTFLRRYAKAPKLSERMETRVGIRTSDNKRFIRHVWEVAKGRLALVGHHEELPPPASIVFVPHVMGAAGREWFDTASHAIRWDRLGLQICVTLEQAYGAYPQSTEFYFRSMIALPKIGARARARTVKFRSVVDCASPCVFPDQIADTLCTLNSQIIRDFISSVNPTINLQPSDLDRIPLFPIGEASAIVDLLDHEFTVHESHREPSVEFRHPGPSPWRHAQDWAQLAVDRPENTPLPPYEESLDPEPPTDHLSYALGIALGRFSPTGAGILDPDTRNLAHALPHGVLYLDGTLDADSTADNLGHSATSALHTAWSQHSLELDTRRKHLRDYLRFDFFDVHRSMYENRPIHWPISSSKKTFVAWIAIHRWHAGTLRFLLAEYLHPTKQRLDGELADLRNARDSADKKSSRAAEKRLDQVAAWREELAEFIANVSTCAEQGPPPPDPKTTARTDDAAYDPDLDDGVMVNSAALWPLLTPQWKDPKKWWKELAAAEGRKDYDWSHLAARYFKARVDAKCKTDPSLAVAHGCFWAYHPERAYAWELRLQDEIAPDFTIDESESDRARARFLAEHASTAQTLLSKELARRTRKLEKAGVEAQAVIEDEGDDA